MSYTYSTWVTAIANFLVVPATDTNLVSALPNFIDDAEQRIYRDLDLLNTVVRDSSAALSTGTRTFNLPTTQGLFLVVDDINVITPAGTSNPENGTRNPLLPASKAMLDFLYPSSTGSSVPQYFGMVTQTTLVVGPWPDQAYQVEVVGTQRPTPLSSTNATTLLSTYFPDLWLTATMVIAAAWQKNFGASADDPRMAMSWETHYQPLLQSAQTEENRKRFAMAGWSSKSPNPQATPPRT